MRYYHGAGINQFCDHMNDLLGVINCSFFYLEIYEQNDNNLVLGSLIQFFLFGGLSRSYEALPPHKSYNGISLGPFIVVLLLFSGQLSVARLGLASHNVLAMLYKML
jgi:hypothetical protein